MLTLIESIFGCAHHRTTFPITPSRNTKRPEGARRGTYIVCLDCGKEFDYNWKEMRIGGPSAQVIAPVVEGMPIGAEQHIAH